MPAQDSPCKALREDITILLTNKCGNQCKHCIPESGTLLPDEMTAADIIRSFPLLQSYADASGIALSGGEPLLRPDFRSIYEVACKFFRITLFTSGIGLTSDLMTLFRDSPPKRVIVSLYGLQTSHDSFCNRKGAFSDVDQALTFFREIGAPTVVNLVCHSGNLTEIKQVIENLKTRGVADKFKVLTFSPLGRGQSLDSLLVKNIEWIGFVDDLREHFLRTDKCFGSKIEVERHVRSIGLSNSHRPNCCSVSIDRNGVFASCIHIDANGDMYPCVMLLRNPVFRFGNIRTIDTIDLCSYYERVSTEVSMIKKRNCTQCSATNDCTGGCLGYHLTTGKDRRCEDFTFDLGCPTRYEPLFLPPD